MYALIVAIALCAAHPVAETKDLSATKQAPARSVRAEEWLRKPTSISLSTDQRRRVDSVKKSYDQTWRRMTDELRKGRGKGEDRMAFTMKALQLDRQLPKAIQKILTPQQRATFDANYLALEGRQP
jgi:hypothetical protein